MAKKLSKSAMAMAGAILGYHLLTAPFGIAISCKDLKKVDYVYNESAPARAFLGPLYDYSRVHEGNNYDVSTQVREVQSNFGGKVCNIFLADNFRIEDQNERTRENVDGKIFRVTATQTAYTSEGEKKGISHRRMFNFLIPTAIQKVFGREGVYTRVEGNTPLRLRPTWRGILLSSLREYTIENPDTGEVMGNIRNSFTLKQLFRAHHYQIQINKEFENKVVLDDVLKALHLEDRLTDFTAWESVLIRASN